jgi:hypothetical protein
MKPPHCSPNGPLAAFAAVLLSLATACHADEAPQEAAAEMPELGLMGTIPIYWGESGNFGDLLAGEHEGHWARALLESDYRLLPVDSLDPGSLDNLDFLLLAQPRALSPAENVALDAWVRGGGRLLLFADPLMTGESQFGIGDRRRPQDVILLSPILSHWGLALEFHEDQPLGNAPVEIDGAPPIPVNLPGTLVVADAAQGCAIREVPVLAECNIGTGKALIVADAALLDLHEPHPGAADALRWLTVEVYGTAGERTGSSAGSNKNH